MARRKASAPSAGRMPPARACGKALFGGGLAAPFVVADHLARVRGGGFGERLFEGDLAEGDASTSTRTLPAGSVRVTSKLAVSSVGVPDRRTQLRISAGKCAVDPDRGRGDGGPDEAFLPLSAAARCPSRCRCRKVQGAARRWRCRPRPAAGGRGLRGPHGGPSAVAFRTCQRGPKAMRSSCAEGRFSPPAAVALSGQRAAMAVRSMVSGGVVEGR